MKKQIAELNRIFKRIYEDDISITISHKRFLKYVGITELTFTIISEFINTIVVHTPEKAV